MSKPLYRRIPGPEVAAFQFFSHDELDPAVTRDDTGYFVRNAAGDRVYAEDGDWIVPDGKAFLVLSEADFYAQYERIEPGVTVRLGQVEDAAMLTEDDESDLQAALGHKAK